MKKVCLVILCFALMSTQASAKDSHKFTCDDSDEGSFATTEPARTHFTWEKNGKQVFNRIFTDAYSASRDKYVTFFCEKKIIRYQLHSCSDAAITPLCDNQLKIQTKLNIEQYRVTTNSTLIDGDDYKFVTHYQLTSQASAPVLIRGLYFMTDADSQVPISVTEIQAAKQYDYVLMGPEGELISGVNTADGKLYFDLSSTPITVGEAEINVGIGAKPKSGLQTTENSSIRWLLNGALGAKGIEAISGGTSLSYDEIQLVASRPGVFSRGTSGLKISHFHQQEPLLQPSNSAQPLYRFKIENLSTKNKALLRRVTLDMRLIGMHAQGGRDLRASDFSLSEVSELIQKIGTPAAAIFVVDDTRNGSTSLTIQLELAKFEIPANGVRILEVALANTQNDFEGKNNDDGAVAQLRSERFLNGSKYTLEELEDAHWVWSDLSEPLKGGARNDWRSGSSLSFNSGALIMKE